MKIHILRSIYVILFSASIIFAIALHQNKFFGQKIRGTSDENKVSVSLEQANAFFENVSSIKEMDRWFETYDGKGNRIGYLLHSTKYAPNVRGYNGEVPLLLALDKGYTIIGIKTLPNRETGDFLELIRENHYLELWENLNIKEALNIQVDAISGATETSEAIMKNVSNSLAGFGKETKEMAFNYQQKEKQQIFRYFAQFLFILLALVSFFYPKKARKYRKILLVLSIVIFGFWLTKMLTLAGMYNWVINGFHLKSQIILVLLLILGIGLPLFTGKNFYCTYVCPYGSLQELCGKVTNRKVRIPLHVYSYLRYFRKYILVAVTAILIIGWSLDLTAIEPFLGFRYQIISPFVLILASLFIVLSFLIIRPWCKYFCPTGIILNLFIIRRNKK